MSENHSIPSKGPSPISTAPYISAPVILASRKHFPRAISDLFAFLNPATRLGDETTPSYPTTAHPSARETEQQYLFWESNTGGHVYTVKLGVLKGILLNQLKTLPGMFSAHRLMNENEHKGQANYVTGRVHLPLLQPPGHHL